MSSSRIIATLLALAAVSLSAGCSDNKPYELAICALADTSGTYVSQRAKVARIIKTGVLAQMLPGDSLFFIDIDSDSYRQSNLVDRLHLAYIPSRADAQRLAFATVLNKFGKEKTSSRYTDISGAMMLCSDYLDSSGAGNKAMLVFSDMHEDLPEGLTRHFTRHEFSGVHVAAMNVIQLRTDSDNPAEYHARLKHWKTRLLNAGAASWNLLVDPVEIPDFLRKLR